MSITLYTAHHCPYAHRAQIALRELSLPFTTNLSGRNRSSRSNAWIVYRRTHAGESFTAFLLRSAGAVPVGNRLFATSVAERGLYVKGEDEGVGPVGL